MTFAGQVAIITGASSGIGWALARVLAAERCKVGLIARREDKLQSLAEEIARAGEPPPMRLPMWEIGRRRSLPSAGLPPSLAPLTCSLPTRAWACRRSGTR